MRRLHRPERTAPFPARSLIHQDDPSDPAPAAEDRRTHPATRDPRLGAGPLNAEQAEKVAADNGTGGGARPGLDQTQAPLWRNGAEPSTAVKKATA